MKLIIDFFKLLWKGWKKFAHILGVVNTRILLTITYFIIFAIASVAVLMSRADLLDRKMDKKASYYHNREPFKDTLQTVKRSFSF
jgi:predicted anti-sigma-YlaC factor YlaD